MPDAAQLTGVPARAPATTATGDATLWRCGGRQCGAGECEHEEHELHRHASGAGPTYAPPLVHEVLRAPGTPLPAGVRSDMERRLGHDLSDIRIHHDATAARSAAAVNAHAYTVGRQIVFGHPGFAPGTPAGQRLLAHELTHAAAGPRGRPTPGRLRVSSPDDPHEVHAEQTSRRVSDGARAPASPAPHSQAPHSHAEAQLHRAVYVCDEYRTRPSGTANPGPGINLAYSGQSVTVDATLSVSGPEADAAKATTIKDNISRRWTGSFADGHSITTRVSATAPTGGAAGPGTTDIELTRSGTRPSHVTRHWLVGSRYVSLNLDGDSATDYVAAHEFGHLLGLGDRYSEGILSKIGARLFGAARTTTIQAGYENNIMGTHGGVLESKNVQDLISRHAASDCVRGHLESPL